MAAVTHDDLVSASSGMPRLRALAVFEASVNGGRTNPGNLRLIQPSAGQRNRIMRDLHEVAGVPLNG